MASRVEAARSPRLRRAGLISAAAPVAVGVLLLVAGSAAASPGTPTPPMPKSEAPANINPNKHPEIVPALPTPSPPVLLAPNEAARQAREWAAQDPYSRVACFRPDGTLLTLAEVDRVDPSQPMTAADQAQVCNDAHSPPPR